MRIGTVLQEFIRGLSLKPELKKKDRRWLSLLENVELLVVGLDCQGRIDYVNPWFLTVTGYKKEELLGSDYFTRFISERGRIALQDTFARVLENGAHSHYQNAILTKAGAERTIAWSNVRLHDRNGNVIGSLSIGRDITDQQLAKQKLEHYHQDLEESVKRRTDALEAVNQQLLEEINERIQAEEKLQQSEMRYRMLAENATDAIWTLDQKGRVAYLSPTAEQLICCGLEHAFGRTPGEVMEDLQLDSSAKSTVAIMLDNLRQIEQAAANGGQPIAAHYEHELPQPGGSSVWIETVIKATFDENDSYQGIMGLSRNVTERHRTYDQLRKLSRAVENSPSSIMITDVHGKIEYVNPAFVELTGFSVDEVLGKGPRVLKSGKHTQAFYESLWSTLSSGRVWRGEFENLRKSGENYWEYASIAPIKSASGQITHFVKIGQDITGRARTEAELSRRVRELYTLNHIARTVATVTELPAALRHVVETVARLFDGAGCTIGVLDLHQPGLPMQQMAQFHINFDLPLTPTDQRVLPEGNSPVVFGELSAGHPIVIEDTGERPLPEPLRALDPTQNRLAGSVLLAPLRLRGELIGAMSIFRLPAGITYSEDEIRLAETVASYVAEAVENARLYSQARLAAVTTERHRLARELHDSVTQSLYSLTLLANGWGTMAAQGTLENHAECFQQLGGVGQQALKEMRLLIHQLRPPLVEDAGLFGALEQRLEVVEHRVDVETQLLTEGDLENIPGRLEDHLFHIAQEALNNSLKHAHANRVMIKIVSETDHLTLTVKDDGVGFDVGQTPTGLGLQTMRERCAIIEGELKVKSAPAEGTTIEVSTTFKRTTADTESVNSGDDERGNRD